MQSDGSRHPAGQSTLRRLLRRHDLHSKEPSMPALQATDPLPPRRREPSTHTSTCCSWNELFSSGHWKGRLLARKVAIGSTAGSSFKLWACVSGVCGTSQVLRYSSYEISLEWCQRRIPTLMRRAIGRMAEPYFPTPIPSHDRDDASTTYMTNIYTLDNDAVAVAS